MQADSIPQKILVVDDDPDIRLYLASLLKSYGYTVIEAAAPEEGHRLAAEIQPAAIILDALISLDNPLNLYRELKTDERLRKIAVIMLADVPRKTFVHYQAIWGGASGKTPPEPDAFLVKPPEAEELLFWLDALLKRRSRIQNKGAIKTKPPKE